MALDPISHVQDHAWVGPVTKHQLLVVAAAGIVCALYIPLARRIAGGEPVRGRLWNFLEALLLYVRDEIARPNIQSGHHDHHRDHAEHTGEEEAAFGRDDAKHDPHYLADKFTPFLWTLFLFILVCNLLGMVPFLGSPTGDISVTLVLAGIVFLVITVASIRRLGLLGYVKSFIPGLQADNLPMQLFLWVVIVPVIAVIEFLGSILRAGILAIRLFANLYAGHIALATILLFAVNLAARPGESALSPAGAVAAVVLGTALSMLELFVAFLQAFVFTLLTSIFLGMQLNPEH